MSVKSKLESILKKVDVATNAELLVDVTEVRDDLKEASKADALRAKEEKAKTEAKK